MKIRKVPAGWLDAPRPSGRPAAGAQRKSTDRITRTPDPSARDQRAPQQETRAENKPARSGRAAAPRLPVRVGLRSAG